MQIGATTLGHLHHRATLNESLESLARLGFRAVDISPTAPHVYLPGFGVHERQQLRRLLGALELECASVNPIELNLISTNPDYAELSGRYMRLCVELAHDLRAPFVVFAPGRPFALNPCPLEDALEALRTQIARLLRVAEPLGVVLAVETVPFGFLQTGKEVADVVDYFSSPWLGATYDVANTVATESFVQGIGDLGDRLRVVHVSGSAKQRWAHTTVREGDLDFAAVAEVLRAADFSGPTIYELINGQDPDPMLEADVPLLVDWGWSLER
jgi:hexulose-6-phosphate isomerase